jgi:hypothetical protein
MIQLYPALFEPPQARQDARGAFPRVSALFPCPATAESVRRGRIALRRVNQDELHAQLDQSLIRRQAQSAQIAEAYGPNDICSFCNAEEGSPAALIFRPR